MQDIQEIFVRLQEARKKQKELKSVYRQALDNSLEYQEIGEKLKTLRERRKQIENTTKEQFAGELTKLEDLKIDIESDLELLSDVAMSKLIKGETVEVKDQYDNQYEPIFSVKFKKVS